MIVIAGRLLICGCNGGGCYGDGYYSGVVVMVMVIIVEWSLWW